MATRVKGAVGRYARKAEAAYTSLIIVGALFIGLVSVVYGAGIPNTEVIMVAALLFGIIEVPRIRGVGEFVKLFLMLGNTGLAILYVYSVDPGVVGNAAIFALILLFGSTLIVALVQQNSSDSARIASAKLAVEEHAPYYAVIGGSALLTLV